MKSIFLIFKWFLISAFGLLYIVFFFINISYDILYHDLTERRKLEAENKHTLIADDYELAAVPSNDNPLLLPFPKELTKIDGIYNWSDNIRINKPNQDAALFKQHINNLFGNKITFNNEGLSWTFLKDTTLHKEGYKLNILPKEIIVHYNQINGGFYGLVTIAQLNKQYDGKISCLQIRDEPSMKIRGVMLDISRDKIPKLETLYGIIDKLSFLKYNHLQLYVEGFSFDYPSFSHLWDDNETPITGKEIQLLDAYCKLRYIDLVPNQNGLGHMQAWLATDEYAHLAECPEGFKFMGLMDMKTTLDPYDPGSLELVEKMTDDMLPNFNSNYFNFNLDEPFELGECKSKAEAEAKGVGMVYLDFVKKLKAKLDKHGKKMMMWGDIVSKHPEIIDEVPDDITVIEWGYESFHPFDEKGKALKESGLNFLVAPGTSCWMTFTGRTENMKGNIDNAVENGLINGSDGMLLADWGDLGHWQYLPSIYPAISYGAAISWNPENKNQIDLASYLSRYLFMDSNNTFGQTMLDLGNYNQFEEFLMPHLTLTFLVYQFGLIDDVLYEQIINKAIRAFAELAGSGNEELINILDERVQNKQLYRYTELINYLDNIETRIQSATLEASDSLLLKDQLKNSIRMIKVGAGLKNFIHSSNIMPVEEKIDYLNTLHTLSDKMVSEHERLWLINNRTGGLDRSLKNLEKINIEIQAKVETLEAGSISRFIDRQKGKAMAVGAYFLL